MTPRQVQVLRAIRDLTEPRGPTVRELMPAIGVRSTRTVQSHLYALEHRGMITMSTPGCSKSRAVKLTFAGEKALEAAE